MAHCLCFLPVRLFSTDLLPHNPGEHVPAFGLKQGLSIDTPKQVEQGRDQTRPSRLVAGPEPRAVVAVKIFEKQDQIAPVRIVLKLRCTAVYRPLSVLVAEK